jgi:hypothetical protein
MNDHFPFSLFDADFYRGWLPRSNPYGRIGVRGFTFIASPKAKQRKRSAAKAARRNTQHARRLTK